jgi:hypothetical protein
MKGCARRGDGLVTSSSQASRILPGKRRQLSWWPLSCRPIRVPRSSLGPPTFGEGITSMGDRQNRQPFPGYRPRELPRSTDCSPDS